MLENMLDYVRIALYALLIIVTFFLYQAWINDHPQTTLPAQAETAQTSRFIPEGVNATPQLASAAAPATNVPALPAKVIGQVIHITTDLLDISIDTHGGDIIEAKLLKYKDALNSPSPFMLLNDDPKNRYVAESGLLSKQGPDTSQEQALYTAEQTSYTLNPGENEIQVKLNWQNKEGLKVTKLFTFTRNSYEVKVAYDIENQSKLPWEGNFYAQLMRTNTPPASHGGFVNLATFFWRSFFKSRKAIHKNYF